MESAKPSQLDQETEHEFRAHVLQLFYDNSVAARNFTFPTFGWETDRVYFWLFFPLVGVIGYYIVWLALISRLGATFRFLLNRNRRDALRLRLILSTLMITALRRLHGRGAGEMCSRHCSELRRRRDGRRRTAN